MKQAGKRQSGNRYHHGDLEAALIEAAIALIGEAGVESLSIRNVGAKVGVSRNALYRHFASKAALLARVAAEGFAVLGQKLSKALEKAQKKGVDPLSAMASAYVTFGISHSSQYRVMFGPVIPNWKEYADLYAAATSTFALLSQGIANEQRSGNILQADTMALAQVVWAQVHGLVTLAIDGQLSHKNVRLDEIEHLAEFALGCLESGLKPKASPMERTVRGREG